MDKAFGWRNRRDILELLQAFDVIPRKRIMMKLFSYGIEKQSIASVASFLSNREITVTVRQQASAWLLVLSGVSQGSVLAPYCFWWTVYYVHVWVTFRPGLKYIKMFADDIKLRKKIVQESARQNYKSLSVLRNGIMKWTLRFNIDKVQWWVLMSSELKWWTAVNHNTRGVFLQKEKRFLAFSRPNIFSEKN